MNRRIAGAALFAVTFSLITWTMTASVAAGTDVRLEPRKKLAGHPALASTVRFSPDGSTLVSGSAPHIGLEKQNYDTVILWDPATGKRKQGVPQRQSIRSLAFLANGKQLAVPNADGVALYDTATGKPTRRLAGLPQTDVLSVAVSSDDRFVAGGLSTGQVLIWEAGTGKRARTLAGHRGEVLSVAFAPGGARLVSGATDGTVRLWDAASGKAERTLKPEKAMEGGLEVVFSPAGDLLAVTQTDGPVELWDTATLTRKKSLEASLFGARSVAFSPDGRLLAISSADFLDQKGVVTLWDLKAGQKLAEGTDPDGISDQVTFSPDGKSLASTGGNTVKLWDVPSALLGR